MAAHKRAVLRPSQLAESGYDWLTIAATFVCSSTRFAGIDLGTAARAWHHGQHC